MLGPPSSLILFQSSASNFLLKVSIDLDQVSVVVDLVFSGTICFLWEQFNVRTIVVSGELGRRLSAFVVPVITFPNFQYLFYQLILVQTLRQ